MTTYREIPASEVPDNIIFTTPSQSQGQAVEVSYSRGIPSGRHANYAADEGDPYKRVWDRSTNKTTFYRLNRPAD